MGGGDIRIHRVGTFLATGTGGAEKLLLRTERDGVAG